MIKVACAITAIFFCYSVDVKAQIESPVTWSYFAKKTSATEAVVYIKATIDNGWHIYALKEKKNDPTATDVQFTVNKDYTINGRIIGPKAIVKFEKVLGVNLSYYEKQATFQQKIKLTSKQTAVKGRIVFMACNDNSCLPADEINFSIPVK